MSYPIGTLDARLQTFINVETNFVETPQAFIIEGSWDLGKYTLTLNKSDHSKPSAEVTFIKRKGIFKAEIVLHDESLSVNSEKLFRALRDFPSSREIFVEHTHLRFTLHIYPLGKRPKTLLEKYAEILPGFGRDFL